MKKQMHEIWKEYEGNKVVWKVQAPKGILTFKTLKLAKLWVNKMEYTYGKEEKEKKTIWNEKNKRWEDEYGGRVCTYDNELIGEIINNCKEFLNKRDTIYIGDICILLDKALEGIKDKKDLTPSEQEDIKRIRNKIKGL